MIKTTEISGRSKNISNIRNSWYERQSCDVTNKRVKANYERLCKGTFRDECARMRNTVKYMYASVCCVIALLEGANISFIENGSATCLFQLKLFLILKWCWKSENHTACRQRENIIHWVTLDWYECKWQYCMSIEYFGSKSYGIRTLYVNIANVY